MISQRMFSDIGSHASKRQRTSHYGITSGVSEYGAATAGQKGTGPRDSHSEESIAPSRTVVQPLVTRPIDHTLLREWQQDPYATQPQLCTDLLDVFFQHIPEVVRYMLPAKQFRAWVTSDAEKSLDELMLLYNILALSSVFSPNSEHKSYGTRFACVARYACDNRHFSLPLVQSRAIIALYYFSTASLGDAWDFCGSAMRAASGLKFNLELEKGEDRDLAIFPFGMNRATYAEARRRTFWGLLTMDRFNGYSSNFISIINKEDIFLRLPCDNATFEQGIAAENPYYDAACSPITPANGGTFGLNAYKVLVVTIYGDIMGYIYRGAQRGSAAKFDDFVEHHGRMTARLLAWEASLPEDLVFTKENINRHAGSSDLSAFMTLHGAFRLAMMRLNRHIPKHTLTGDQIAAHLTTAKQHARGTLEMQNILCSARPSMPNLTIGVQSVMLTTEDAEQVDIHRPYKLSSPFTGNAVVCAMDIITARVAVQDIESLLTLFQGAQTVLGELTQNWVSARNQQAMVQRRIAEITEVRATAMVADDSEPVEMKEALDKSFAGMDSLYG